MLRVLERRARASTSGAASPTARPAGPGSATPRRSCSRRPRASPRRSSTCSRSATSSSSTRRSRATGPSSPRTASSRSRCAHVLTHRAGLPAVDGDLTLDDVFAWHPVVHRDRGAGADLGARHRARLSRAHVRLDPRRGGAARHRPRRSASSSREEAAEPLGLELWIGLPEAIEPRVATNYTAPEPADPEQRALRAKFMGPDTLLGRALEGPSGLLPYGPIWNTRALHAAELPSSNGIAHRARARALLRGADRRRRRHRRLLSAPDRRRGGGAAGRRSRPRDPDADRFASGFALPPMLSLDAPTPHSVTPARAARSASPTPPRASRSAT